VTTPPLCERKFDEFAELKEKLKGAGKEQFSGEFPSKWSLPQWVGKWVGKRVGAGHLAQLQTWLRLVYAAHAGYGPVAEFVGVANSTAACATATDAKAAPSTGVAVTKDAAHAGVAEFLEVATTATAATSADPGAMAETTCATAATAKRESPPFGVVQHRGAAAGSSVGPGGDENQQRHGPLSGQQQQPEPQQ
jgi:hypothetical protein